MNIAQALKEKNRLLKKIEAYKGQILVFNRRRTDASTSTAVDVVMTSIHALIEELCTLRGKISAASVPIQPYIAKMEQLRQLINFYAQIPTNACSDIVGYGENMRTINYIVQYSDLDTQKLMQEADEELNSLQDRVDLFNATTNI